MSLDRRRFLQATAVPLVAAHAATHAVANPAETAIPFRLGLVTYNVAKDWDIPTILKVCKATGISPVELRTTHKHGVEPSLTTEERKTVRQRFADGGVEIWGLGSVCEFHAADTAVVRKHIETCKAFVQLAADLGSKGVKVRPNGFVRGVPQEKTLDQIGKALIECGKAADEAGVEIWVEVHGGGTSEPAHMKTIMEACGHSRVGITWNSNATDLKNKSVAEAFRMLRPWLKSCHINDLYKDIAGVYPYRELFRLLRESGYDRTTLIEVGRAPADVASGEEFLRYYKALWTELCRG